MATPQEPRNHHFAPQFYLRNFSSDAARKKVHSLAKYGDRAIWQERSIEYIGNEEDLYSSTVEGVHFSVEDEINRHIENPITQSSTWDKISKNQAEDLGPDDGSTIFTLIRHLERRTPHALQTMLELIDMAEQHPERFDSEELEMYAALRDPDYRALFQARMSATLGGLAEHHERVQLLICRSKVPLWTSTTPVMSIGVPGAPELHLPVPGQPPYASALTLNRFSFAVLALANFGQATLSNVEITDDHALGYNRFRLGQFGHFRKVDHLICDREGLEEHMAWAGYRAEKSSDKKIVFVRTKS
ncbi:MAG: DUF4238 domain-containing protein [Pseudomonadota bacterium]